MKKVFFGLLFLSFMSSPVSAKDVHEFSCDDSDNGPLVINPAGKTQFTWVKNNEKIFNRVFTDAYSASRNKYVAFYCQENIIRYRLFDCNEALVAPFCTNELGAIEPQLLIEQRKVETSGTLVDGDDYKFITHYLFNSETENPVMVTELYFVNNVDEDPEVNQLESSASEQYEYALIGPEGELVNGVTTNDGRLFFDLKQNPIEVGTTVLNIGIAAKPKSNLETAGNSSIRWILNPALGSKGVEAENDSGVLAYGEILVYPSRTNIFSRGLSGLKVSHFNPQTAIINPSLSPQGFYRMRVENISNTNAAQLRRLTLEMRVMGMEKQNGQPLNASDYRLVEIGPDASVVGTPNAQIFVVEDNRNSGKALSLQIELADFIVPANDSRGLELQIANLVNDAANESDDDGVAVQLRQESFLDGTKYPLSQLEMADWVWTDFSGEVVGGNRQDWRSGLNLDANTRPIIIRE
jgi:hypothetical protein